MTQQSLDTTAKDDKNFLTGIRFFTEERDLLAEINALTPVRDDSGILTELSDTTALQTILAADAMRYLTLEITSAKSSGHPGGFASSAEVVAALFLLGYKNLGTEVGHHAPGYYSAAFLDGSLAAMGIQTVAELKERYREYRGLLGHITGAIPGMVAPAGPLGQGQHFALAGARLHPGVLFPFTVGDGGIGEPYVMSALQHFIELMPEVTNFLPVLIWNGYSQEHHSICSRWSNQRMIDYFSSHGFASVRLVDAKEFDTLDQEGPFVDTTMLPLDDRLRYAAAVLKALKGAAEEALSGTATAVVVKQIKGAGVHTRGSKSHNLTAAHTPDHPDILAALQSLALSPAEWKQIREVLSSAGGGPAAEIAVTEAGYKAAPLAHVSGTDYPAGEAVVPTTALGEIVGELGSEDPTFMVTNADGNEASGMMNINRALTIRHPSEDELYAQGPGGRVYEPLSEDACAGLAAATALHGGRALWCSYESFAVNGLPVWQTVTQALAELRRESPSAVALFTAGALEQGRNGWTHQRPEIEAYFAALVRNGNVYPYFPIDANSIQEAFLAALDLKNAGAAIFASKNSLPVRLSRESSRKAIAHGAVVLEDSSGADPVTLAVLGDLMVAPVLSAAELLKQRGRGVKVVAVIAPRRLFRARDVAWREASGGDDDFMSDAEFEELFGADRLLGITGGATAMLEPLILRSKARSRDLLGWHRGETAASAGELLRLNGLLPEDIVEKAVALD